MDRARLGRTELEVSVASLGSGGASRLGQRRGASFGDSVRLVRAALDRGVNAVDTAAGYGTEEIVGAAIRGRRDEVVLSTKSPITEPPWTRDGRLVSGARFAELVEASLRRLGTDHVDVLHVHGLRPDHYEYCVAEILPALHRLRDEGKIRFTGVSEGWGGDSRHRMVERALQDDHFDVMMVGLNVVNHSALGGVLPLAREKGVGIQCMYAVRGKLGDPALAREVVAAALEAGEVDPGAIDARDPLGFLVEPGVAGSLAEACYRFCRHAPGVDTVLTGTGSVDHLIENLRSISAGPLPAATLERIGRAFGRVVSVTGD